MVSTLDTTCGVAIRCLECKQEYVIEPSTDARCSHCGKPGWLRIQQASDPVILDLLPNIDLEAADLVGVGRAFLRSDMAPHIVLNLHFLQFVSSSFIAGLVALQKAVCAANGRLVLSGANPVIREIFQIMKLDRYFDFGDRGDAGPPAA